MGACFIGRCLSNSFLSVMQLRRFFFLIGCVLCVGKVFALQPDSLSKKLDDVEIVQKRVTSSLKGDPVGELQWDMGMMHELPKILGNSNPMHYVQLLPGVQTSSEYDAGIHVQGCDNSHNFISISGVPIYNVNHLFGFFSTFNASHFPSMSFIRNPLGGTASNRLGGVLDMELQSAVPKRVNGEFSIGPISSQGTFRTPLGGKRGLIVSLRAAYLDLLYGQWLKIDGSQIEYGFRDLNVTYLDSINAKNSLKLNMYIGGDKVGLQEDNRLSESSFGWGNLLLSAHWEHLRPGRKLLDQTLYFSGYENSFSMDMQGSSLEIPSNIKTLGYRLKYTSDNFIIGADAAYHDIVPQTPKYSSGSSLHESAQIRQYACEYSAYFDYFKSWGEWLFKTGIKGNAFSTSECGEFYSLDPYLSVMWDVNRNSKIKASYGRQHQYLFRCGFSNMGLPTEFWFASGDYASPQYARTVSLAYDVELFDGDYQFSLEGYYKRLYNQLEYNGNILDFVYSKYSLHDVLLKGDGENFGVNLMLSKRTGNLTGWISYSLGRALREFSSSDLLGKYPASHERIHELNSVATYRFNSKWSVGGTFVLASGTPFTAPSHFYLLDGVLVTELGEHNANRLKPYCRLDLSVNYNLHNCEEYESGINLSLYNATLYKNDIYYRLKIYNDEYGYRPMRFLMRILPSISFYYRFK